MTKLLSFTHQLSELVIVGDNPETLLTEIQGIDPSLEIHTLSLPIGTNALTFLQNKDLFFSTFHNRKFHYNIKSFSKPYTTPLNPLESTNETDIEIQKKPTLDTTNPEYFIFNNDVATVHIWGGINTLLTKRLDTTLHYFITGQPYDSHRDSVNLYASLEVEKFCERASLRTGLSVNLIQQSLNELTALLEEYRLNHSTHSHKKTTPKTFSVGDTNKAISFLKDENLLAKTNELLGELVVNEADNRLLLYLSMMSRKLPQPLHCVCLSPSLSTYLIDSLISTIPEEDLVFLTTLSKQSLYFWESAHLQQKILVLPNLQNQSSEVLSSLQQIQQRQRISKSVALKKPSGRPYTALFEVNTRVSICTTASPSFFTHTTNLPYTTTLFLDETPQQIQQIIQRQQHTLTTRDTSPSFQVAEFLKHTQTLLKPLPVVVIPQATHISFPISLFPNPIQTHQLFFRLASVICWYHQHSRPHKKNHQTGEVFIETTARDLETAQKLLTATLKHKIDELSPSTRQFIERLKSYLTNNHTNTFTTFQLRIAGFHYSNLKRYLPEAIEKGHIGIASGSKSKGYTYFLTELDTYPASIQQLEQSFTTKLLAMQQKDYSQHTHNQPQL